jgi:predicted PurR-regulated permease PerM
MCKIGKFLWKLCKIALVANILIFVVFFFDLDGKLLYNVVEPFLKKHYDNMQREDTLQAPYDMDKFPAYK